MKRSLSMLRIALLILFLDLCLVQSVFADSTVNWRFALPRYVDLGPQIGFAGSQLTATRDNAALFTPTPVNDRTHISLDWGVTMSAHWKLFSLTIAPRREEFGLETKAGTVEFSGNPFPHTLNATTQLAYNVWPVSLGMGWASTRSHFQVRLGVYSAFLQSADVHWTVDGSDYKQMPGSNFQESYTGWLLGMEYGLRMGPGEWVWGLESERGFRSLTSGMAGALRAQSMRAQLAYAWRWNLP